MTNELLLRVEYQGNIYDLPVDSDVPLRVDMSSVEAGELGKFFGVGSQTFSLPGTKEVNRFFNYAYDVSRDDIPAMYNTIPCSVVLNGETVIIGALQLISVTASDDGFVTYNVQVYDKVLQFEQALGSKLIRNGDWTNYSHSLDITNITSSWEGNLLGGAVFYPIVDYGNDEDEYTTLSANPIFQLTPISGATFSGGYIGDSTSPIRYQQWQPAIRVKDTLDVIFDQVGFTYTGSFTETDDFNNLYILNKPNEGLGIGSAINNGLYAYDSSVLSSPITSGVFYTLNFTTPTDPGNNFNDITDTYTAPATGDYNMTGGFSFITNPVSPGNSPVTFTLQFFINGSPTGDQAIRYVTNTSFPSPMSLPDQTFPLTAGDTVTLRIRAVYSGTALTSFPYTGTWTIPNQTAPTTFENVDVSMADQWQADAKSIDIVNGLLQQFNLIMIPETNNRSVIRIEEYDDWIRDGEVKDWTSKYDTAKRIQIDHTVDELPRELFLQNAEDADRFSKISTESFPNYQYGTLRLLADNNISQGSSKVGDYFAPVVLGGCVDFAYGGGGSQFEGAYNLNLGTSFVIPHLYKFENNKQKAYNFKPRIGYKVSGSIPTGESYYIESGSSYVEFTDTYHTLSNVAALPVVSGSTNDLHFNNSYTLFTGAGLNLNDGVNNFENYWETYYNSLYWEGSKKVTLDLFFEPYEYKQIKLNDRVLIKGQAYKINKIKGFNISHRDVVTVELIKLYPSYWQL